MSLARHEPANKHPRHIKYKEQESPPQFRAAKQIKILTCIQTNGAKPIIHALASSPTEQHS